MPIVKNECYSLCITGMTSEGLGIGRVDGFAVFVPHTAIGDRLTVRIVKVLTHYAFGRIEILEAPAQGRTLPPCPHHRQCGGCVYQHLDYQAECAVKAQQVFDQLTRAAKVDPCVFAPILPSPQIWHYRNKAQFPVASLTDGSLAAGFYKERSHTLIPCSDCLLQPPIFSHLVETILSFFTRYRLSAYQEETGKGLLRHIYLRQGEQTGDILVCLVLTQPNLPHAEELVQKLRTTCSSVRTVVINENRQKTNVILGERNHVLYGDGTIQDELCGLRATLSPFSFYQVNRQAAEQLYRLAGDYASLSPQEVLLDLYCGVGLIGLSMASSCRQVIGVEVIPEAIENARQNAAQNHITNARFLCADATQAAAQLAKEKISPDVVLLDPPRKGCSSELLHTVCQMSPSRIVMISCNYATLARDLCILQASGYAVTRVQAVDLFPHTKHVETIALLTRP